MNSIALGLGTLTIILFIVHALMAPQEEKTSKAFFFAGSNLNDDRIAANLSATASSLGTALLFILFQTPVYGWLIFLIILMFLLGQYVFLKVASPLGSGKSHQYGSVYRVVFNGTNSNSISWASNIINVFTYGALLLVEIIIGASIFAFFAPSIPNATLIGVIFIASGVALYVLIGGFEVVTFSDKWQFWFIFTAVSMTTIFLILITANSPDVSFKSVFQVFTNFPESTPWILGTFVANVIIVNSLLPICQSASWQRFSSAKNNKQFINGYVSAFKNQIIWAWLLFAFVSALFFKLNGSEVAGIETLFAFICKQSSLGGWFVFPLLFSGLVAAIVSTADSLMMSLLLGIEDFSAHFKSSEAKENSSDSFSTRKWNIFWGIVVVVSIIFSYVLFNSVAASTKGIIIGLMFTAVGQTILLFPIIIYSVRYGEKEMHKISAPIAIASLFAGFIALWWLSVKGIREGDIALNQIAPIVGLCIVSIGTAFGVRRQKV